MHKNSKRSLRGRTFRNTQADHPPNLQVIDFKEIF
jgi:hypothetical protein